MSKDVGVRVVCAGDVPDHVTIHRFRAEFADAVPVLFAQVLMLCARLGMGQLETVALDGTKIAANAGKAANRDPEGLRRLAEQTAHAAAAEHAVTDAAEDTLFGADRHGDQPPAATDNATDTATDNLALARVAAGLPATWAPARVVPVGRVRVVGGVGGRNRSGSRRRWRI